MGVENVGSERLRVLVVDDNRSAAIAAAMLIRREGHAVEVRHDGQSAIVALEAEVFDLVITDLRMEPVDGLAVVEAARARVPPVEAIVLTAFGSVEAAVQAMRLGALDFLTKPVSAEVLLRRVREFRKAPAGATALVGDSPEMERLRADAPRFASVRSAMLIMGEAGTGRRHFARWLHENGRDSERGLVTLHPLRAISLERLESAGTLLVPNLDQWSRDAQDQLARLLDPLDSAGPPRLIATTSPIPIERASEGPLSPELYFRFAVLLVHLQPLRRRARDVIPLLHHLLDHHGRALDRVGVRPATEAIDALRRYPWPGNVRELSNLAERAVILGPEALEVEASVAPTVAGGEAKGVLADGFDLAEYLADRERELLEEAHARSGGDIRVMSRLLGMERARLRYRLEKYGLLEKS
jgi:DNA-binding NtrC family response regulator